MMKIMSMAIMESIMASIIKNMDMAKIMRKCHRIKKKNMNTKRNDMRKSVVEKKLKKDVNMALMNLKKNNNFSQDGCAQRR